MKNLYLFLFAFALFSGCMNGANDQASEEPDSLNSDSTIGDTGFANSEPGMMPYLLDSLLKFNSEKELVKAFGREVKHSIEWGAEGLEQYHCTFLFPETPNQVEFTWTDTVKFTGVIAVRISGEKSGWKTKEGIKLGTTMKELEILNKKPFSFFGFGWDYGGTTMWDDGYLATTNNRVVLGLKGEITDEFGGLLGDAEFKSNDPLAQKANPVVMELWLSKN